MKIALATLAVCAAAALGLFAGRAQSQEVLPVQDPFLHACHSATQLGQLGGVNISRCRKVAVVEEGNFALVTVKVWVDGQGIFLVRTALQKSVWSQSALDVQPG